MLINKSNTTYTPNHCGYFKNRRIALCKIDKSLFNLTTNNGEFNHREHNKLVLDYAKKYPLSYLYSKIKNTISDHKKNKNKELQHLERNLYNKLLQTKFFIDGKVFSLMEFVTLSKEAKTEEEKELYYNEYNKNIKPLDNDLKELIIARNKIAKQKGYDNYYQYLLKTKFNTSEKEIDSIISNFYSKNDVQSAINQAKKILAKHNETEPEKLKNFQLDRVINTIKIGDYIKDEKDVYNLVKNAFTQMGFDIDKYEKEGLLIYDIAYKANKEPRAYCHNLNRANGIYANLRGDINSIRCFMHEMGHAMFRQNNNFFIPPKKHINEAIAMLFEDLTFSEKILKNYLPKDKIEEIKNFYNIDKIIITAEIITNAILEKEMYKNPNQDFAELKKSIVQKYIKFNDNGNSPCIKPHYIINPVYYQNYLRAIFLADKIKQKVQTKLRTELPENNNTANYLKRNILQFGGLLNDKLLNFILNSNIF